jgi:uncharacterized Rmd1/YagE family protein
MKTYSLLGVIFVILTCTAYAGPVSVEDTRYRGAYVSVYTVDDIDNRLNAIDNRLNALSGSLSSVQTQVEGKLTDFETKLRQETIEAVNKIPDKLIAGELADKLKDQILAAIRGEMQKLKSDILSEVDSKIAAQSGH